MAVAPAPNDEREVLRTSPALHLLLAKIGVVDPHECRSTRRTSRRDRVYLAPSSSLCRASRRPRVRVIPTSRAPSALSGMYMQFIVGSCGAPTRPISVPSGAVDSSDRLGVGEESCNTAGRMQVDDSHAARGRAMRRVRALARPISTCAFHAARSAGLDVHAEARGASAQSFLALEGCRWVSAGSNVRGGRVAQRELVIPARIRAGLAAGGPSSDGLGSSPDHRLGARDGAHDVINRL